MMLPITCTLCGIMVALGAIAPEEWGETFSSLARGMVAAFRLARRVLFWPLLVLVSIMFLGVQL